MSSRRLACFTILFTLCLARISFASVWTYEVIVEREGEDVSREIVVAEIARVHATVKQTEIDAILKQRRAGRTDHVIVSYEINDHGMSGPILSRNGATGELMVMRYWRTDDYLLKYNVSPGAKGTIDIKPSQYLASVFALHEKLLLTGDGTLEDRFLELCRGNVDSKNENPFDISFTRNGNVLLVKSGNFERATVSYDRDAGLLKMVNKKIGSVPAQTLYYKQIKPTEVDTIESIPLSTPVIDSRLGEEKLQTYLWDGQVPPVQALQSRRPAGGGRSQFPMAVVVGIGFLLVGIAFLLVQAIRKKVHSKQGN